LSENNRRAKYYELTRRGRQQLATEADAWDRLVTAVGLVMKTA
jgi:DNA-binding PadR family transcriptional regulator